MPIPEFKSLWHSDKVITQTQEVVRAGFEALRKAPTIDTGRDLNGNQVFGASKQLGTHIVDGTLIRGVVFQGPQVSQMVHTGTGSATVSAGGNPSRVTTISILVFTAGAVGTAVFQIAINGVLSTVTSQAQYTEPNSGLILTFSGTFVAGDTYSVNVTNPDVPVSHGLGRSPNGFHSVKPNAPAFVHLSPTANPHPENAVLLNATGPVTTDLWIF